MHITDLNKTPAQDMSVEEGISGTTMWWLLAQRNDVPVPNFELRYLEVAGGGHTRKERHSWEHQVFVVRGQGVVEGEDGPHPVKPGDAVFVAPNELHQFRNEGEEPFGFVCVIPLKRG